MNNLLKRSAIILPALLIGSAATLGMYAYASTGTSPTPVPSTQQAVSSQTSGEQADAPDSSSAQEASDPAGGPNDQVGDQNQAGDAVDTPDAAGQGGAD